MACGGRLIQWAAFLAAAAIAGCGASDLPRLVDYLDELEFDVPLETASYVTLGKFDIPIATPGRPGDASHGALRRGEWMRLQFELAAETAPPLEQAVAEAAERRRGALNDAVLSVVRTSSAEDLADPRLAALKVRLTDAVWPLLGEDRVRQLVFNKLEGESLKASGHDGHAASGAHGEHEKKASDAQGHH
jgi:hypothetical protein